MVIVVRVELASEPLNRLAIVIAMTVLACGVVLWLAGTAQATTVLNAGLVMLMLTPAVRLATILVDALRRRDALVAGSTLAVVFVLAVSLFIAFGR